MSALSLALGEGRLTMAEFDERCTAITAANFRTDLDAVFCDLPQTPQQVVAPVQQYSAQDIELARRNGKRTRLGIFGLSTIASVAGVIFFDTFHADLFSGLSLLIIPTVFILLYVMKIGPDAWYAPSIRELERNKRQLVRMQQLELEASRAHEIAAQKAQRKQQLNQLTGEALNIAQQTVSRFNKRKR